MKTISDLESDLKDEIENKLAELVEETRSNRYDSLTEMASSWVPNSDRDLTEVFISYPVLGRRTEFTTENMDVFEMLRANLGDRLRSFANLTYDNLESDYESLKDDFESEGLEVFAVRAPGGRFEYQVEVRVESLVDKTRLFTTEKFKSEYDAIKWWEKQGEADGTNGVKAEG